VTLTKKLFSVHRDEEKEGKDNNLINIIAAEYISELYAYLMNRYQNTLRICNGIKLRDTQIYLIRLAKLISTNRRQHKIFVC
jgi:hypothetical protein